jgi:hypothetical protein
MGAHTCGAVEPTRAGSTRTHHHRCEVLIQFHDLDPAESNPAFIRANWEDREPETGRVVSTTQAGYDEFKRFFGSAFQIGE